MSRPILSSHFILNERTGRTCARPTLFLLPGPSFADASVSRESVGALAALAARRSAMSSSFAHLRAENRPKMQCPFVLRTWGSASRRARAGGLFVIRPFAETRLARKRAVRVFLRKTRARAHKTRGHCIFGRFSQRTCAKLGNLARVSVSARLPVPGQSASAQRSGHRIASPASRRKPSGAERVPRYSDAAAVSTMRISSCWVWMSSLR